MRYSELAGKEIICIDEGIRLGVVDQTDLIIDLRTGEVKSMIIPYGSRWFRPKLIVIPWRGINKIGRDLIIVDLTTAEDYAAVMKKIQEVPRWNKPPFFG
ncbi:MAG TPA: YlmC/YmxH family sporulation protein [Firmicutes bacterium]|jgi:YlmC/YmxH family sporulation protein|nr:YlmC/YmxH family sporulation protein [Bacillota bacterium]HHT42513.1 YlmC/YmxH family sporulation protein [Bacillota bacterium]